MKQMEVRKISLVLNREEFLKLKSKYNLNTSQMAEKMGLSRTQVWRVVEKHCKPGETFIAGFKQAFPNEEIDKFFYLKTLQ